MAAPKPLVFVAMPFGKKSDAARRITIDFDDVYERGIKPAVQRLGDVVECIRADEERSGGVIHLAMFERLLLAEIVVVDVTLANPNVYYELGVRHMAKPRATIIVGALEAPLPFDIAMIRAVPYTLRDGKLEDEDATALIDGLLPRLRYALEELESKDSPLFQVIPTLTETRLPEEVTESFRERARYVEQTRERLSTLRAGADEAESAASIAAIEHELGEPTQANAETLLDVLLSYRDVRAWDRMIALAERLPGWMHAAAPAVDEHLAFALNRRNGPGDRARAVALLEHALGSRGDSAETAALLARIYKDQYLEARAAGQARRAAGFLGRAIEFYRRGFTADPRDYYPGVNLATLLALQGTPEAQAELRRVLPAVRFAVQRVGGLQSGNYWQIATWLELALLENDAETVTRALERIATIEAPRWNLESTAGNLALLRAVSGEIIERELLEQAIAELEERANPPLTSAPAPAPS